MSEIISISLRSALRRSEITSSDKFPEEMRNLCELYCTRLSLNPDNAIVASHLIYTLINDEQTDAILQDHGCDWAVPVSIHIASALMDDPRSSWEISAVVGGFDAPGIRAVCDRWDWRSGVDASARRELNWGFNIQGLDLCANWTLMKLREFMAQSFQTFCSKFCASPGLSATCDLATMIGSRMLNMATLRTTYSSSSDSGIAAACIYMAGHLTGSPHPLSVVAKVVGCRPREFEVIRVYRDLYAQRHVIFLEHWLPLINGDSLESALAKLPEV